MLTAFSRFHASGQPRKPRLKRGACRTLLQGRTAVNHARPNFLPRRFEDNTAGGSTLIAGLQSYGRIEDVHSSPLSGWSKPFWALLDWNFRGRHLHPELYYPESAPTHMSTIPGFDNLRRTSIAHMSIVRQSNEPYSIAAYALQ